MEKQNWLQWRKIGSSDASAIMGVSPWATPYQLWEKKVSGQESVENAAMMRGKTLEGAAIKWFEKKKGIRIDQQVCVEHKDYHFITATLDGLNADKKILVEVKCPGEKTHAIALKGAVPEHYYPQLQHQMEIMGYDGMFYVSFDGQDGAILEVQKDAKYVKNLVAKERDFWDRIINWNPPALTDKDHMSMEGDANWELLAEQWKELIKKKKEVLEAEEELRKAMINICSGHNSIGHGVKLSKSMVRGSVDYSEIPDIQGLNLDQYRKPSYEKWVFSLTK